MIGSREVSRIVGEARETTTRNELSAMENYLRFFFDLLIPDIDNVLYMDVDTLILKDVSQVIDALYANPSVTYAFAERPTKKTAAENFNVLALKKCYRTHYKPTVSQMKSREIFNHGVFAINLRRYYSLGCALAAFIVAFEMFFATRKIFGQTGKCTGILQTVSQNIFKIQTG